MSKTGWSEDIPIQVLETWEAIRKRPAMYVGDVEDPGLPIKLLTEALCEARAGHQRGQVTRISISVHGKAVSDRIQIVDDGPGWPVKIVGLSGKRHAENLLTQLYGCRAFKDPEHKGFCNMGVVTLNALSRTFEFTTWTDGRAWSQRYEGGRPVTSFTDDGEAEGFHGTQMLFALDATILKHTLPTEAEVQALAEELRGSGLLVDVAYTA